MTIMIKGADMPEHCGICNALYHGVLCHGVFRSLDEKPKNCPLVEIPEPHGRLIDADKLKAMMEERRKRLKDDDSIWEESVVDVFLDDAPTVIEAEGKIDNK